ncbi:large proline-rich protein BAG6-like isoform X3 [Narcine bancroftii]|uniref:large proline-rich protein BAG6-like isoform X3 n=1 Tax=Narcine bancroftii TaxID=1343680 RepID=UPI0038315B60
MDCASWRSVCWWDSASWRSVCWWDSASWRSVLVGQCQLVECLLVGLCQLEECLLDGLCQMLECLLDGLWQLLECLLVGLCQLEEWLLVGLCQLEDCILVGLCQLEECLLVGQGQLVVGDLLQPAQRPQLLVLRRHCTGQPQRGGLALSAVRRRECGDGREERPGLGSQASERNRGDEGEGRTVGVGRRERTRTREGRGRGPEVKLQKPGMARIEVTVKTLDSQSRTYEVEEEFTVKEFKDHISSSVNIPADKQRLIYQGRVLQDDKKLKDYDVHHKVIHLVERAPPQAQQTAGGLPSAGTSTSHPGAGRGAPAGPHDRNANSYVMVGTFNLPVNLLDPQQIQQSVQQVMAGLSEAGRSARVTTSTGSEPRVRLVLAQHMLRDIQGILNRLEDQANGTPQEAAQSPAEAADSVDESAPAASPVAGETMEASSVEPQGAPVNVAAETPAEGTSEEGTSTSEDAEPSVGLSSATTQTDEAPPGPNHPSPTEYLEVLMELQRVEARLQPFVQRYQEILSTATTADYNNNTESREEDQRIINLVGEALRFLGNTFVALSDLRCNLAANTPRHLHVVRPMSHYASPMVLQQALPIQQINVGTTVTMTTNGNRAQHGGEGQSPSPAASSASPPAQSPAAESPEAPENQGGQQSQGQTSHPRVIRITHQTMEPVVMMQMNLQGDAASQGNPSATASSTTGTPGPGAMPHIQIPGMSPEFMQSIMHQITQQAMAAAGASSGQQVTGFQPSPARVVITRPPPPPPRQTQPPPAPQPGAQVPPGPTASNAAPPLPSPATLAQMITGLVGQLLMQPVVFAQPTTAGNSSAPAADASSPHDPASNGRTSSSTGTTTTTAATSGATDPSSQPPGQPDPQLSQLLGSLLGAAGTGTGGMSSVGSPTITVTLPGMPAFVQGMTDFLQAAQGTSTVSQPAPQGAPQQATRAPAPLQAQPPPQPSQERENRQQAGADTLTPEFFTSVVQGVLSSMMGSLNAQQGSTESIADFIQRLSGTSNIFEPGSDGAIGFFGDLLSLICQNFSMVDMIMLLHGQFQPLQRIQSQLSSFFQQHYLRNQEPTEQNIRTSTDVLINGLEEYIQESFASVTVRDDVDITRTNLDFLREQFNRIATHILLCSDATFGHRLLELCNQALFECLALNLYSLRGEQSALTSVINDRIRRMSVDVNPSLVNWLTTMMTMRLQVIMEHVPVTEEQILQYVRRREPRPQRPEAQQNVPEEHVEDHPMDSEESVQEVSQRKDSTASPAPATTAEEVMSTEPAVSMATDAVQREGAEAEPWVATVPPEWVPVIRQDIQSQRKMKPQPPLSDAYLSGMPAKRRKTMQCEGPPLSLADAVGRAAKAAGVKPLTSAESLASDLERAEAQEAYRQQIQSDIQKRIQEDPEYNPQRFPNTHAAFEERS